MSKLPHTVESQDQIPEGLGDYYAEVEGKFYLQADGMVPKGRVDEFRENNIALLKENDNLKTAAQKAAELEKQIAELKSKGGGAPSEEDLEKMLGERLTKRVEKMRQEFDDQLKSISEDRDSARSQLSTLLIDNGVTREASAAGVRDTALADVLLRAQTVFQVKDGRAVPMKDGEVIFGKDGQTPMTIKEWLAERTNDSPHWFKEPKGGGARHNSGASGANAPQAQNVRGMARMRAARS